MHGRNYTWRLTLAVAIAIGTSAWAGPIMPWRRGLSDADHSLAGLKQIELIVDDLPPQIKDVGLTAELLREMIAKDLRAAGYRIIDTKRVSKLGVLVSAVTDPNVPGGIAYSVNMVLNQLVKIGRLDQMLFVPTHAQVVLGLEAKQNLSKSVKTTVTDMTRQWINLARIVTEAQP